jgi:hypothetical protein
MIAWGISFSISSLVKILGSGWLRCGVWIGWLSSGVWIGWLSSGVWIGSEARDFLVEEVGLPPWASASGSAALRFMAVAALAGVAGGFLTDFLGAIMVDVVRGVIGDIVLEFGMREM